MHSISVLRAARLASDAALTTAEALPRTAHPSAFVVALPLDAPRLTRGALLARFPALLGPLAKDDRATRCGSQEAAPTHDPETGLQLPWLCPSEAKALADIWSGDPYRIRPNALATAAILPRCAGKLAAFLRYETQDNAQDSKLAQATSPKQDNRNTNER